MADSMSIDASEVSRLAVSIAAKRGAVGAQVGMVIRKTAYDIQATAQKLTISVFSDNQTGAYRNSIGVTLQGNGMFGVFSAEIGPTVNYAPYLEEGTSRMPPKPIIRPAVKTHEALFLAAMAKVTGDIL